MARQSEPGAIDKEERPSHQAKSLDHRPRDHGHAIAIVVSKPRLLLACTISGLLQL